jgi:hypothetical protein
VRRTTLRAGGLCLRISLPRLACLELAVLFFQEGAHCGLVGQLEFVLGDEETVVHPSQGVSHEGMVLVRARRDTDRRVVILHHFVLAEPGDVGIELAQVLVLELVDLQFDQDMAFYDAVAEDKVHEEVFVADEDSLLTGFAKETPTEFQQEVSAVSRARREGVSLSRDRADRS